MRGEKLPYAREKGKGGIFGFHNCKRTVYAPDDVSEVSKALEADVRADLTSVEEIGLTWDEINSLAMIILAYASRFTK